MEMTLGQNIRRLRQAQELTIAQLAEAVDSDPSNISRLELGKQGFSEQQLNRIARALSVPLAELFAEQNAEIVDVAGKLPLISDVQAGDWSTVIDNFHPGDAEEWLACPFKHGPNAFVLRVSGYSMYNPGGDKSYAPGEFIAVDPSREARHKNMVIARVDHEDKATFKQLLVDPDGAYMLQAINPSHAPRLMSLPEGSRIVGVVIGKWVPE